METLKQHIDGLSKLGKYLRSIYKEKEECRSLFACLKQAEQVNGWFTQDNCLHALETWGSVLTEENIIEWITPYPLPHTHPKTVGLILAGNIPLVGFHDVLSVLMSGHNATVKLSSSDPFLIPFIYELLQTFSPVFNKRLVFTTDRLEKFDAVIATGSNNAARYFDFYFSKVPNLIRKNRNGVAVLSGQESNEELTELARDIVLYYGLGCRSISKIYVPKGYDLNLIFGALYPHASLMDSAKYANNYDYNKAVFLMSDISLLDNGFLLMREHDSFGSPVACLHYWYYDSLEQLENHLEKNQDNIQCISTSLDILQGIPLGKAQQPALSDYADGVDTLTFLCTL